MALCRTCAHRRRRLPAGACPPAGGRPAPAASAMPCFTFYIFNRKGACQYYHEWQVGGGWAMGGRAADGANRAAAEPSLELAAVQSLWPWQLEFTPPGAPLHCY